MCVCVRMCVVVMVPAYIKIKRNNIFVPFLTATNLVHVYSSDRLNGRRALLLCDDYGLML